MNVLVYAATAEMNWKMNLEDMGDFRPKYTFYNDFSIAEFCEIYMRDRNAVKKTYNEVIKSWGKNIKAVTEIAMVLNHKSWAFYQGVDSKYLGCSDENKNYLAQLYCELYEDCVAYIEKTYKGNDEALSYYYSVTD